LCQRPQIFTLNCKGERGIKEHVLNAGNISSGTLSKGCRVMKEEIKTSLNL
jgi:hypothetical protein